MATFLEKVKKVLNWIWANMKLVVFIGSAVLLVIFVLWWGRKNKIVRDLENQLSIANAKLKVERLAIQYNTTMQEIKDLKEKDEVVKKELQAIEKSLGERLKDRMTAEEIAAKFREIGVR